jgi:hypothetical protein
MLRIKFCMHFSAFSHVLEVNYIYVCFNIHVFIQKTRRKNYSHFVAIIIIIIIIIVIYHYYIVWIEA